MCAQEATSAKRSTAVQSRGALLNEVLRYTNARAWGRGRSPHVGFERKREKKNQPVSIYSRAWVGSIRYCFYDKLKIDLVCVLSCCSCVQTGEVEFLVMKRTFALRYTVRRPKTGREAIQTMQEGNIISRFC